MNIVGGERESCRGNSEYSWGKVNSDGFKVNICRDGEC